MCPRAHDRQEEEERLSERQSQRDFSYASKVGLCDIAASSMMPYHSLEHFKTKEKAIAKSRLAICA